ncbi:MAG: flagellar basal-body MS-ring/collar protein FliF [Myxococcota bacterium]
MAANAQTQNLVYKARQYWSSLSLGRKILLGTLAIFLGLVTAYLAYLGNTEDYATLFAGLKVEDAAEITQKLDEKKIPYQIEGGGSAIKVPVEHLHSARMMLASEGMPRGGAVGFELFDQPKFGMTAFEQRMNYRRALQGELRRTIRSLEEVDNVNLHLVLPKKGTFREDDQEASASVVLQLRNGQTLRRDQVNGIVNLVAAAVEGLTPEQVTVLDQQGNMLSAPRDAVMSGTMPALELRQQVERDLEQRIAMLLEPAVGPGKARIHVTTEMDFRKVEQRDEMFDPKTAVVRSENTRQERAENANDAAGGVPGAQANAPGAGGGAANPQAEGVISTQKTANYEINRTTRVVEEPIGTIKKLNIAVLIDGNYTGEGEEKTYVPRSEEELVQLEAIVKTAVGFDEGRGDQVVVRNMPFVPAANMFPVDDSTVLMSPDAWRLIRYGIIIVLALLILLFLVRPIVNAVTQQPVPEAPTVEVELAQDTPETIEAEAIKPEIPNNRLLAIEYAINDPRKTAQILRAWLLEDEPEEAILKAAANNNTTPAGPADAQEAVSSASQPTSS